MYVFSLLWTLWCFLKSLVSLQTSQMYFSLLWLMLCYLKSLVSPQQTSQMYFSLLWLILWFLKSLESPQTSHMYFSLLWLTSVISKHLWAHKHCTCTDCLCCEYVCVLSNNINCLKNNHNHYNYTVFLRMEQDYVSSTDRNKHKNYLNSHN